MSHVHVTTPENKSGVRANQLKLIGIFAIALVPVLLAVLMYFGKVAIPTDKTNKGLLIWPPVELSKLGIGGKSPLAIVQKEKTWFLMLAGNGTCEQDCQELLHTMRQVHVSMGRELQRVSRLFVADLAVQPIAEIKDLYPELKLASFEQHNEASVFSTLMGMDDSTGEHGSWHVWLVDPLGNVLLRYDASHSGYDMIDDLKKLLKLSNIG